MHLWSDFWELAALEDQAGLQADSLPLGHWGNPKATIHVAKNVLVCLLVCLDNPLQCSCLENPRDRGAWWAAIYGVAQSWTRLK